MGHSFLQALPPTGIQGRCLGTSEPGKLWLGVVLGNAQEAPGQLGRCPGRTALNQQFFLALKDAIQRSQVAVTAYQAVPAQNIAAEENQTRTPSHVGEHENSLLPKRMMKNEGALRLEENEEKEEDEVSLMYKEESLRKIEAKSR